MSSRQSIQASLTNPNPQALVLQTRTQARTGNNAQILLQTAAAELLWGGTRKPWTQRSVLLETSCMTLVKTVKSEFSETATSYHIPFSASSCFRKYAEFSAALRTLNL